MTKVATKGAVHAAPQRKSLASRIWEYRQMYLLLLIPVVLTLVYKYYPMYGIQMAFRNFKPSRGILGSEWVGFDWFIRFFEAPNCWRMELFLNDGDQAVTTLLYTPQGAQDVLLRAPKPIRYTFESHEIDMMEDDGE